MGEKLEEKMPISKLEELVNQTADGEVEIMPNGDVVRLNHIELLEKNYRLEQERNAALLRVIKELRDKLRKIADLAVKP